MANSIQNFLKNNNQKNPEHIYIFPNIPQKKINGVLSSYATSISDSDIGVIVDDTLFGSAKEGVVFASDKILFKTLWSALFLGYWHSKSVENALNFFLA